jgi:hypothetical protein
VTGAAARADKNARSGGPYWTSYHAAQSGGFARAGRQQFIVSARTITVPQSSRAPTAVAKSPYAAVKRIENQ